jgi:3-oxoacyl-[acyl-carrier-protein] synthase II
MAREVAVTGYGVFTGFGFGDRALREGVFAGRPGFRPVTRFDTTPFRARHAAEYTGDGPAIPDLTCDAAAPPRQYEVLLACGRAALGMAGLTPPVPVPVLLGTQGDFRAITRFWKASAAGAEPPHDPYLAHSAPGQLPYLLAGELGLVGGRTLAFVNGCVASSNAIIHACRLIEAGRADMVVCGGAYLVDEEFFAKFDSGRAFAKDGCVRPFAKSRSGLLLGDGVAVLVLEAAGRALARGAEPLAYVAGWGMAGDAYHVCQPHPDGQGFADAANQALWRAGLAWEQVGYVNAHGTGTLINDIAETRALRKVFGGHARYVPVSSTKSTTGHMLEASGAVETVICLLALREGMLPPTAGYTEPDPACDLDYIPNVPQQARPRYALTLNAAFGGVNTAIILERS